MSNASENADTLAPPKRQKINETDKNIPTEELLSFVTRMNSFLESNKRFINAKPDISDYGDCAKYVSWFRKIQQTLPDLEQDLQLRIVTEDKLKKNCFDDIPLEVLATIFEHLTKSQRKLLGHVCRIWGDTLRLAFGRQLEFDNCWLTDMMLIGKVKRRADRLLTLTINGCGWLRPSSIVKAISECNQLTELNLNGVDARKWKIGGIVDLFKVISKQTSLTTLGMPSHNRKMASKHFSLLKLPSLTTLDIANFNFTNAVSKVPLCFPDLKHLTLNPKLCQTLEYLPTVIESLNLESFVCNDWVNLKWKWNAMINEQHCRRLSISILDIAKLGDLPSLRELTIYRDRDFENFSLAVLDLKILRRFPNLTHLDIDAHRMVNTDDNSSIPFSLNLECLTVNLGCNPLLLLKLLSSGLKELNIDYCSQDGDAEADECSCIIRQKFQSLRKLKIMSLYRIQKYHVNLQTLCDLDISQNAVSANHFPVIAEHCNLINLTLRCYSCGYSGICLMKNLIMSMTSLQKLHLHHSCVTFKEPHPSKNFNKFILLANVYDYNVDSFNFPTVSCLEMDLSVYKLDAITRFIERSPLLETIHIHGVQQPVLEHLKKYYKKLERNTICFSDTKSSVCVIQPSTKL